MSVIIIVKNCVYYKVVRKNKKGRKSQNIYNLYYIQQLDLNRFYYFVNEQKMNIKKKGSQHT